MAAALAACVVLSACASGEGGQQATTTSPSATEAPGNPWDLPIEQRPALFDPCAEIPVEAIEQGVGGPVELDERLTRHRPGRLMGCGWSNDEVQFTSASSWKSKSDYLADPSFVLESQGISSPLGRGLRLSESGDGTDRSCLHVFFTDRGSTWIKLDLVGALSEYRGERFSKACDVFDNAISPVLPFVPGGDF
ncbi:MAG TPA: DUF3558 family protein [Dietzia sp.]|nr:DUF3558 family protein [Dietzia sp.]